MEVDPGREKALYELHKSTGASHDIRVMMTVSSCSRNSGQAQL